MIENKEKREKHGGNGEILYDKDCTKRVASRFKRQLLLSNEEFLTYEKSKDQWALTKYSTLVPCIAPAPTLLFDDVIT